MTQTFKAKATTSRWETDRVSGGVTGVGSTFVNLKIEDHFFEVQVNINSPESKGIDPNKWKRVGSDRGGHLSVSAIGLYEQEVEISIDQIRNLLSSIFEYEGQPLNPYRFQSWRYPEWGAAIRAYAKLSKRDIKSFVTETLYPKSHPYYQGYIGYQEERQRILDLFGF